MKPSESAKIRYTTDPVYRSIIQDRAKAYAKKRWNEDLAFREAKRAQSRERQRRLRADPSTVGRERERSRNYQNAHRFDPASSICKHRLQQQFLKREIAVLREWSWAAKSEARRQHRLKRVRDNMQRQRDLMSEEERRQKNEECRKWRKAHPELAKHYAHKRRAAKLRTKVGDGRAVARFIAKAKAARLLPCYICGKPTTRKNRDIEHVIPLSRGGAHSVENLGVACRRCNSRKCAKTPQEIGMLL